MIEIKLVIEEKDNKQVVVDVARFEGKTTKKEQLVDIVVEMQLKDILSNFKKKESEEY